ncbi:unnamed protein product, partial [marine sediment metagenome]
PYDCILDFESKKSNRYEVSGVALNQYGCHTNETRSIEIKAPRGERGENKDDIRNHFQSTMSRCLDVAEEIRSSEVFTRDPPPVRDYSYLEQMPESLTSDAILDLNTILRDQPIHDELVHEAVEFLGNEPFLLEESLRDGTDEENGVLFAAGKKGYFWIRGEKRSRFISNVIVDTVEWNHIRCFAHRWQIEGADIEATYSLTEDGRYSTVLYQWIPTVNENTLQFPWLLQRLNGSWILADVMYKYSGKPLPASWFTRVHLNQLIPHKQRYYH